MSHPPSPNLLGWWRRTTARTGLGGGSPGNANLSFKESTYQGMTPMKIIMLKSSKICMHYDVFKQIQQLQFEKIAFVNTNRQHNKTNDKETSSNCFFFWRKKRQNAAFLHHQNYIIHAVWNTLPTNPHLGSTLGLDFGCGITSTTTQRPQGKSWKSSKGFHLFWMVFQCHFDGRFSVVATSILPSLVEANGVYCVIHANKHIYINICSIYIYVHFKKQNKYELPKSPCPCATRPRNGRTKLTAFR